MRKIILIRDSISAGKHNYTKATMPLVKENINSSPPITLFDDVEESNDVSELIINQILATAISGVASANIYVVESENLRPKRNAYSFQTVRYFVNKSKESGDRFLFVGNNKMSKLVARLWGFKEVQLL